MLATTRAPLLQSLPASPPGRRAYVRAATARRASDRTCDPDRRGSCRRRSCRRCPRRSAPALCSAAAQARCRGADCARVRRRRRGRVPCARRAHERREVRLDRIVGRMRRIGVAHAADAFRRSCERLVREPQREPLIDVRPFLRQLHHRQQRRRRAVDLGIAVRQEQGANTLRLTGDEQLRHGPPLSLATRSTLRMDNASRNSINISACASGPNALSTRDDGVPEAEEIGSDAAPMRRQSLDRIAPLIAAERKSMEKQCGVSASSLGTRCLRSGCGPTDATPETPLRSPACAPSPHALHNQPAHHPRAPPPSHERTLCDPFSVSSTGVMARKVGVATMRSNDLRGHGLRDERKL